MNTIALNKSLRRRVTKMLAEGSIWSISHHNMLLAGIGRGVMSASAVLLLLALGGAMALETALQFMGFGALGLILVMTGLIGLYLVSRQWDEFLATFAGLWSIEGALSFAVAIVFVKVLHELGHAYTAVNYGCRVPAMGVAFMVMTPILYTDVTDAWRLGSRRSRLAIDSAGVVAELKLFAPGA